MWVQAILKYYKRVLIVIVKKSPCNKDLQGGSAKTASQTIEGDWCVGTACVQKNISGKYSIECFKKEGVILPLIRCLTQEGARIRFYYALSDPTLCTDMYSCMAPTKHSCRKRPGDQIACVFVGNVV